MLTKLANLTYGVNRVTDWVRHRFPGEKIFFSAAATVLETTSPNPVGWSLQRFGQKRAVVVFTDQHIILKSFYTLWGLVLLLLFFCVVVYLSRNYLFLALVVILLVVWLSQRRPYEKIISWQAVQDVQFDLVQGITATGTVMAIRMDYYSLNIVTRHVFSEELLNRIRQLASNQPPTSKIRRINPNK